MMAGQNLIYQKDADFSVAKPILLDQVAIDFLNLLDWHTHRRWRELRDDRHGMEA